MGRGVGSGVGGAEETSYLTDSGKQIPHRISFSGARVEAAGVGWGGGGGDGHPPGQTGDQTRFTVY